MKKADRFVRVVFLAIYLLAVLSLARPEGVCVSKGGRFPPYSSEGKPPKKVAKGPKDLTLCSVFRKKTCCDVAQTHPALVTVRKLALTGEANGECVNLWELLECSICDPRIGVQPGRPVICASLCDRVFEACSDAYFSMDAMSQVLVPCGTNEIICAKASKWVSNGTDLCRAAGFSVKGHDTGFGLEKSFCYGGKASLDSVADSWKAPKSDIPQKFEKIEGLEDLIQQMKEMPLIMKVYWAVGGLVLTAGLLVLSKRKNLSQRKKIAAVQHAAKKIETQVIQKSSSSKSWKGKGRKLCD